MRNRATKLGAIYTAAGFDSQLDNLAGLAAPLDLRFAADKSLDPRISFTRASSATFVDSSGVLRSAVTNLLLRSEEFENASWTVLSGAKTVTPNTTVAPNGTLTADIVTADGTSGAAHFVDQTVTLTAIPHAFTVYAKAGTNNFIQLRLSSALGNRHANFDVSTGATGTSGNITSSSVQPVGNGWYRCSMVCTPTAATGTLAIIVVSSNSAASGETNALNTSVILWGAQLEQASTVGEYVPTTSTINSAPRFDHAITSSTTNLKTFSDAILVANTYGALNSTLTTVTTATPTASTTASLFTLNAGANTGNNTDGFNYGSAVTLTNSTQHTQSLFVKPVGATVLRLRSNTSGLVVDFTLTGNGTAPSSISDLQSASIVALANGWYRVSWTFTTTTSAPGNRSDYWAIKTNVADGTNGLYVVGAQLEQSATVGPYVPTTTAAATSNSTDSLGLLVEEARTNGVTNNTMVGAVAGTPGTIPTGWLYATTSSNGLTQSIVGTGVENGINYIDFRYNGTTIASPNSCAIGLTNATGATGQTWTASTYWKLVGGTTTGVTGWNIGIIESTSGGGFVTGAFYSQTAPTSAALITQRPAATRTLSGGATVGMVTYPFNFAVAGSTAIDFTIRIGLPQLEQGAFATSVIPTTSATVTRAADVAQIAGSNFGVTRNNLLLRTEEFDNASWSKTNSTVTPNSTTAPNGTATADRMAEDTVSTQHFVAQNAPIPSSTAITASVYVKFDSANRRAFLQINDGTNYAGVILAQDGSVAAQDTGFTNRLFSAEAVGSGWYRLRMSLTTATATNITVRVVLISGTNTQAYLGDGTSGLFLWGAQLETGSTVTPYIPSTTTFTSRASGASYFDAAGVLQWKPQNLLVRSEEFDNNTAWPRSGATLPTVTANAGIAPDGNTTADLWTRSITGSNHISQAVAKAASAIQYTFSVFVKQSVGNFCALRCQGIYPNKVDVVFNISSGTISSPATVAGGTFTGPSASITPYPNGWYRLTVTATSDTNTAYQCIASFSSNGTVIDGIDSVSNSAGLLWGAQLEQNAGSFAVPGEYTPTVATATGGARNSAFLPDSSGVFRGAGPLLLEEARTNSIRNNTMIGAVAGTPGTQPTNWNILTATELTRTIVGIGVENGINYIDLRYAGTLAAARTLYTFFEPNGVIATTGGQQWTGSVWLKVVAGSLSNISTIIFQADTINSGLTYVNSPYGVSLTPTSTFTRFSATGFAIGAAAFITPFMALNTASSGIVDITLRIGMPQLEQGAFPTSVIPTSTSAVTRAADVSTSTATSFFDSSWYNQTEGTVFAEFGPFGNTGTSGNPGIVQANNGTGANRVALFAGLTTVPVFAIDDTSVNQAYLNTPGVLSPTVTSKLSGAYRSNDFARTVNGGNLATDASGTVPTVNQLQIGAGLGGIAGLNGTIKRLTYWPVRLTNAILQQLTR